MYLSAKELSDMLSSPNVRVVDTRSSLDDVSAGRDAWVAGHVPGAVHADWILDWGTTRHGLDGMLVPRDQFLEMMAHLGIDSDTMVVAYDDIRLLTASRFAWAMLVHGRERVAVLDGGYEAWIREGLPITSGGSATHPVQQARSEQGIRSEYFADTSMVHEYLASHRWTVVDCRWDNVVEASGEVIPSARCLSSDRLLTDDGQFRSPVEIAAIAESVGVPRDGPTLLYCGRGVSAAAVFVALRNAGYKELRVYDGSFAEWKSSSSNPVESVSNSEICSSNSSGVDHGA